MPKTVCDVLIITQSCSRPPPDWGRRAGIWGTAGRLLVQRQSSQPEAFQAIEPTDKNFLNLLMPAPFEKQRHVSSNSLHFS